MPSLRLFSFMYRLQAFPFCPNLTFHLHWCTDYHLVRLRRNKSGLKVHSQDATGSPKNGSEVAPRSGVKSGWHELPVPTLTNRESIFVLLAVTFCWVPFLPIKLVLVLNFSSNMWSRNYGNSCVSLHVLPCLNVRPSSPWLWACCKKT